MIFVLGVCLVLAAFAFGLAIGQLRRLSNLNVAGFLLTLAIGAGCILYSLGTLAVRYLP